MNGVNEHISIRTRTNLVQFCIPTYGCRLGKCVFCNYGQTSLIPLQDVLTSLTNCLNSLQPHQNILLLNAIGSLLDKNEVPTEYVVEMCKIINQYDFIKMIIMETHYTTINEDILFTIRTLLPNKTISIEVGLETCNPCHQKYIKKPINLDLLLDKVRLAQEYDISVEANVFLGIPFVSIENRIQDAVNTIRFALDNGFSEVTLFPCNLKVGTELQTLYDKGQYQRVSHFEVLETLDKLSNSMLNRVAISWYGDWVQMDGDKQISQPPLVGTCEKISHNVELQLSELWQSFYKEYRISHNRKDVILKYKLKIYPLVGIDVNRTKRNIKN